MINVTGFRYCRLGTANLEETVKFATDIIGLEEVGRENGSVYMRGYDRDHNICYFEGDPNDHTLGLQLDTFEELDAAESAAGSWTGSPPRDRRRSDRPALHGLHQFQGPER